MAKIKITQGFDIRLDGAALPERKSLAPAERVGLQPPDFYGVKPKLLLKEGESVKAGTAVYFSKERPELKFASPVSGKIKAIHYGERRALLSIEIESDGKNSAESFRKWSEKELEKADAEELSKEMLEAGVWPMIRQRPFSLIADPKDKPKAVFVSMMATAPLASDPMLLIQGKEKSLQLGLKVMQKFTSGKVHVVFGEENALYKELQGVEKHIFTGPHPAGNVGIHIHHIDPLNRGEKVWFAAPQDLVRIAEFLTTGRYPSKKVVSVAGSGAKNRYYYEVFEGVPVADLVKGTPEADLRYINGDVLSGAKSSREGFLGFYSELLTVIPEGRQREFLGWIMPGFNKLGFSKTFFANLFPKKAYALDTNMHGGHRAFIQTGAFEQVLPMDIHPGYLLKSIMAHDIAEMEGLGIYEISEEDFALLAYIDPSKNDIIGIVRSGFDLIRKEA
jgi:Na+-transporting NADH:ubiquinone oxidoreductase subunit A